jgi:hypothetical protein
MHATILLLAFWAGAFVSLCAAVLLMAIFFGLIENDLELLSLGREAVVAGVASLVEGAGVWLVVVFLPVANRALALRLMIIPVIIVALIYKISHLVDWSRYEVVLLLVFQVVIGCFVALLIGGRFEAAIFVAVGFVGALVFIGAFAKSL